MMKKRKRYTEQEDKDQHGSLYDRAHNPFLVVLNRNVMPVSLVLAKGMCSKT